MKELLRPLFLGFTVCVAPLLVAQESVMARVVDSDDRSALPFATVLVQGSTSGTITNAEGWFRLPLQGAPDSLRISFVGYRTLVLPLVPALNGTEIRLERSLVQLAAVEVRPGEDLYKRVVAASNWLRRAPVVESKLFFGMETHSGEQPVEVLQAYYNASFKAAMLTGLDFVQGRVGIAPKDDRHFINFNTARAFALLDIHAEQGRYPQSPLSFTNARRLAQDHQAEWVSAGSGPDGVDHVRVVPRGDKNKGFTLDLWLSAGTTQVRALELSCSDLAKHPFVPLLPGGNIDAVDLRYKQTWSNSTPYLPEVMELEYRMAYSGTDFQEQFHTHAIMHSFDHGTPFIPTIFPWIAGVEEYRMIAWMPEDSAFWQRMSPPLPTERQLRDQAFIAEHDVRANAWYNELGREYDLLRPMYTAWSPDARLDLSNVQRTWEWRPGSVPRPDMVGLRAHLYLALDTSGGEFRHYSMAVFDELRSFHVAAPKPWTRAFLNIYFDLCEMERLRMEEALNAADMDVQRARRIHTLHSRRLQDTLESFMAQTRNGQARTVMNGWNEQVKEALAIDNLGLVDALPTAVDLPVQINCRTHHHLGLCIPDQPGGSHLLQGGDRPAPVSQNGIGIMP